MEFEYAFLLDALLEEQAQNITIDTTQIPFRTARRQYVIIDAPGHKEFLKNMITGAASADAAVLVIAANEGVREQSRRHAYLLSLLGIKQIVVVVNKMDLAGYAEQRFREIEREYREFLATPGLEPRRLHSRFRPKAGTSRRATGGKIRRGIPDRALLETLDELEAVTAPLGQPLRFCVQDVYRFDERRIIAGRIESGALRVGEELVFSPANKSSTIATIESWNSAPREEAIAGDSIGITLARADFRRARLRRFAPRTAHRSRRTVFAPISSGSRETPLRKGAQCTVRLATQEVRAQVVAIEQVMDSSTLAISSGEIDAVGRNEVGRVTLQTRGPLVMDNHDRVPSLGRFVVVDNGRICGGGIIFGGAYTDSLRDQK